MSAYVTAAAYALPSRVIGNEEIASDLGRWSPEQLLAKTGIEERRSASESECASDFATAAALRLFEAGLVRPDEVEFLFFVTQSPDHLLPATACTIQNRLGLPTTTAAFDINQGCSGYVYALGVANGWIASGLGSRGLVLTGDTYTRYIRPHDAATRPLFGDAGTASIVEQSGDGGGLSAFVFGTDGSGAENLIVRTGALRAPTPCDGDQSGPHLFMDGAEVFAFTLKAVPAVVDNCLAAAGCELGDIDLFLMHQANGFMLSHLGRKIGIPRARLPIRMERCGNTVSSSIPILMADLATEGSLAPGMKLMLVGFGVGYSWAACVLELDDRPPTGLSPEEDQ